MVFLLIKVKMIKWISNKITNKLSFKFKLIKRIKCRNKSEKIKLFFKHHIYYLI
jgi:hypothetical protein